MIRCPTQSENHRGTQREHRGTQREHRGTQREHRGTQTLNQSLLRGPLSSSSSETEQQAKPRLKAGAVTLTYYPGRDRLAQPERVALMLEQVLAANWPVSCRACVLRVRATACRWRLARPPISFSLGPPPRAEEQQYGSQG